MTFQRTIAGLLILTIAGFAGAFYMNWRTATQLLTVKAFVEGYIFPEAVAACEKAQSSTPFKWNTAAHTSVIGLNLVKPDKYTTIASYTLVADNVYCATSRSRRKQTSDRISSNGIDDFGRLDLCLALSNECMEFRHA
jgi:hypothetical protein